MKQFKHLIKPYIIWASILIVVPLILIVLYAFTSDGNEVLTLHFTWANFAKFLETTCYPEILPPGYPDHTDLPGLRISAGIHYLQIFRKGAELSDPYGHHSHVDQHASPYLCMDEHSF